MRANIVVVWIELIKILSESREWVTQTMLGNNFASKFAATVTEFGDVSIPGIPVYGRRMADIHG